MFYESRILAGDAAKSLLNLDATGSVDPIWSALGVTKYEDAWGTLRRTDLPPWTEVADLGDLYDASKDKITPGPLLSAMRALPSGARSVVLSRITAVIAAREEMAFTLYGEWAPRHHL